MRKFCGKSVIPASVVFPNEMKYEMRAGQMYVIEFVYDQRFKLLTKCQLFRVFSNFSALLFSFHLESTAAAAASFSSNSREFLSDFPAILTLRSVS